MLVYVLEDSRVQRLAITDALEAEGWWVCAFATLDKLRDAMAAVRPCVILADLHLRGDDQWGTSYPLFNGTVPVVVMSTDFDADRHAELARALLERGAAAVVAKADLAGIVAAVRAAGA